MFAVRLLAFNFFFRDDVQRGIVNVAWYKDSSGTNLTADVFATGEPNGLRCGQIVLTNPHLFPHDSLSIVFNYRLERPVLTILRALV